MQIRLTDYGLRIAITDYGLRTHLTTQRFRGVWGYIAISAG